MSGSSCALSRIRSAAARSTAAASTKAERRAVGDPARSDRRAFVDAAIGGARRDEEKARAKERVSRFATSSASGDPKNQRPELWSLYNTPRAKGEHMRVFPISNWTELDVWQYVEREQLAVPSIYYAIAVR